jgi:phosphate:Na+ symporter
MGQNIGTCVTALISSVGTNKNARRAAMVHLSFNIIGTTLGLLIYGAAEWIFAPAILDAPASIFGIAVCHSIFNVFCTVVLFPAAPLLEKLAVRLVPAGKEEEKFAILDERLLATPPIALERCRQLVCEMAEFSKISLVKAVGLLRSFDPSAAAEVRDLEGKGDQYEDVLGTYLVRLSSNRMSDADSAETSKLLKAIGDFERITDHSVNILESAEELKEKKIIFTPAAQKELQTLCDAVAEIVDHAVEAFLQNDLDLAMNVEPLEQVIDGLKSHLRDQHILRLRNNECTIEAGFVWADLITNLERTADHCSNIAVCILDVAQNNMNQHKMMVRLKNDANFRKKVENYSKKYQL